MSRQLLLRPPALVASGPSRTMTTDSRPFSAAAVVVTRPPPRTTTTTTTRTLSAGLFSPTSPLATPFGRLPAREVLGSSWFSSSFSLRRGYSLQQHHRQRPDNRSSSSRPEQEDPTSSSAEPAPDKLPLTQRIKALTKKYGWWAVGVYTVLSLFDFGIAFGLVSYLGMARVQRLERTVKHWVKERTGWSWAEEEAVQELQEVAKQGEKEIRKKGYDSSFWAQVAIVRVIPPFRSCACPLAR